MHATIHACAALPTAGPSCRIDNRSIATLQLAPTELFPLWVTFEEVLSALEKLPRMFIEPDGSFVWVAPEGEPAWQLDGQLQDRGASLDHVEVRGTCCAEAMQNFLNHLRGDREILIFHLVEHGVLVDERTALVLFSPELST